MEQQRSPRTTAHFTFHGKSSRHPKARDPTLLHRHLDTFGTTSTSLWTASCLEMASWPLGQRALVYHSLMEWYTKTLRENTDWLDAN
jgi:hypothetical protein